MRMIFEDLATLLWNDRRQRERDYRWQREGWQREGDAVKTSVGRTGSTPVCRAFFSRGFMSFPVSVFLQLFYSSFHRRFECRIRGCAAQSV